MPSLRSSPWQRGYTTLVTTLVLLLLTALVAYYTSASAILETRMSANEVRSKQAIAAAQAGLDAALEHMRSGGICQTQNSSNCVLQSLGTGLGYTLIQADSLSSPSLGSGAQYAVSYCSVSTPPPSPYCRTQGVPPTCNTTTYNATPSSAGPAPANTGQVMAYSCGWSADGTAAHLATVAFSGTGTKGTINFPPLISIGTTNLLTGGASIMNYYNDLNVWTGASILGQSNTGKTFVRDTTAYPVAQCNSSFLNTGNSPSCNNPPTGYVCSTQGSTIGFDVIQGDTNLSTLTSDTLFQAVYGDTEADWRDNVASYRIDPTGAIANSNTSTSFLNSTAFNTPGAYPSVWIEGNTTLSGTIGQYTDAQGNTQGLQKTIVIHGDLSLGSNTVIYGNVFVTGNFTASATATIYGSVTVGGTSTGNGNLKIIYDPFGSCGGTIATTQPGTPTKVNGTWKDW